MEDLFLLGERWQSECPKAPMQIAERNLETEVSCLN